MLTLKSFYTEYQRLTTVSYTVCCIIHRTANNSFYILVSLTEIPEILQFLKGFPKDLEIRLVTGTSALEIEYNYT